MQRIKHPPIRNKISLADPTQVRAWTRRLAISADSLKTVIDKVGNSVAAVTKEVELRRAAHSTSPAPPIESPPNVRRAGARLTASRHPSCMGASAARDEARSIFAQRSKLTENQSMKRGEEHFFTIGNTIKT
jgi:hypothetical protein